MSTSSKFKSLLAGAARALKARLARPFVLPLWLPRRLVELRCAQRLDRTGRQLLRMRARIDAMSAHLDSGALDGPVMRLPADRDGGLRRMLAGLRDELAVMRRELARWHVRECGGRTGARLGRALARVNGIVVATSAAAQALEARLDAHEGRAGDA
jgi:hypothetical protein